jgi:hypothetical protein
MKIKIFFLLLAVQLSVITFAETNDQLLEKFCAKNSGKMLNQWTCPNSGDVRGGPFCEFNDRYGRRHVVNGCTGTFGSVGSEFFNACVIHDFCYHNEPGVSGKSKDQCDKNLLADMESICDQTEAGYRCYFTAQSFYDAVRIGGGHSWSCSKNNVDYIRSYLDL